MRMTLEELTRRLAEADVIRAVLRRATIACRKLGEEVLASRRRGPERPHDGSAARR
ncbi:MAG: hypothetical protein HY721_10940 [Planctomycetes bacterium]|nr:hypothetical protein [Planctomycetota bacterium]